RAVPGVAWAEPTGSLRRGQDFVGDIEVLAPAADAAPVVDAAVHSGNVSQVLQRTARRATVVVERAQIGVRVPEPAIAGAAQPSLTGRPVHDAALRALARARGWTLTAAGLTGPDGTPHPVSSEAEIYHGLGLPFIPPEIRHGEDEIEAAVRGSLPRLIAAADIRGDLHMHSTWSDGRD